MISARRSVVAAGSAATALVAAVLGAAALAHDARYDSRITIKSPSESVFKGRVSSERQSCERGRTVRLYHESGVFAQEAETDEDGRWRIEFVGETGYYAKVTRRVRERAGHRHVCKPDRSPTVEPGSG